MKANSNRGLAACIGLLLSMSVEPSLAAVEPLKMGGSGSGSGTMQVLAEAYRRQEPSFALNMVPHLGTEGGAKAVAAGVLDFALVARPLKAEERAAGLVSFEYGRTPYVLVTNKAGVKDMTLDHFARLIADPAPSWEDGTPVRLILRAKRYPDAEYLGRFSPGVKQALAAAYERGVGRAISDQESADDSERQVGSLSTSTVALLRSERRSLTVLSIGGISPSLENFASGAYPHGKTLTIVTNGKPNEATQHFIDFIASDRGRQVLTSLGHLVTSP